MESNVHILLSKQQARRLRLSEYPIYVASAFYLGFGVIEICYAVDNDISQRYARDETIQLAFSLGFNPDVDIVEVVDEIHS